MYDITWDSLRPEVQEELREINPGWVETVTNFGGKVLFEVEESEKYLFDRCVKNILDYYEEEFGRNEETIVNTSRIPLAYTTDEFEREGDKSILYEIQVYVNLDDLEMVTVYTFPDLSEKKRTSVLKYKDIAAMEQDLAYMSFDSLVSMPDEIYHWLESQEVIEEE